MTERRTGRIRTRLTELNPDLVAPGMAVAVDDTAGQLQSGMRRAWRQVEREPLVHFQRNGAFRPKAAEREVLELQSAPSPATRLAALHQVIATCTDGQPRREAAEPAAFPHAPPTAIVGIGDHPRLSLPSSGGLGALSARESCALLMGLSAQRTPRLYTQPENYDAQSAKSKRLPRNSVHPPSRCAIGRAQPPAFGKQPCTSGGPRAVIAGSSGSQVPCAERRAVGHPPRASDPLLTARRVVDSVQ